MIYFLILIVLVILAVQYDFRSLEKRGEKFWYNSILVILILIAGLRFKVGGDTLSYFRDFENIPLVSNLSFSDIGDYKHNPLWTLISSISKSIINDFAFFQLVHAAFINVVIFRFIRNNTVYRFTAILLYYLFAYLYFNMEIMRESLAIAILLLAYPFYLKGKWLKYYLTITTAILFHFSALILLLFPLFRNTNLNFRNIVYVTMGALLAFFLINYFPLLDYLLFTDSLHKKYIFYSNYTANINGMIGNFIMYGLFPFTVWLLSKRVNSEHDNFKDFFLLYFTMVIFYVAVSGFGRFLNYMIPFMIIFFSNFINALFKNKRYRPIRVPLVFLFITLSILPKFFYYTRDTSELAHGTYRYNTWYPYSSIFEKKEFPQREILHIQGLRRDTKR